MEDEDPKAPADETVGTEEQLEVQLSDPQKKEIQIWRVGLEANDCPREGNTALHAKDGSGKRGSAKEPARHLTPSGKLTGSWSMLPFYGWLPVPWMAPFTGFPSPANRPPIFRYKGHGLAGPSPSSSKNP